MKSLCSDYLLFAPRKGIEPSHILRGDFVKLVDALGKFIAVTYRPGGTTKRDQGDLTIHDNAGHFKYAIAPISSVEQLNFLETLCELEMHFDAFGCIRKMK